MKNRLSIYAFLSCCSVGTYVIEPLAAAGVTHIYVSPAAQERGDGSYSNPFPSLTAARDYIRGIKQQNGLNGAIEVRLLEGEYFVDETFKLDARDSGRPGAKMIYRSWGTQRAVITGTQIIRSNEISKTTDPRILSRIPESAREHIREFPITADFALSLGNPGLRGTSIETGLGPAELILDGIPAVLAYWPAGKWATISRNSRARSDNVIEIGNEIVGRELAGTQVTLYGFPANEWSHVYLPHINVESPDHGLRVSLPAEWKYGMKESSRWRLANLLNELDAPGEYFVDRNARQVYFRPPIAMATDSVRITAASAPLVTITGASHVTLSGIDFNGTRSNGIVVTGGNNISLNDVRVENIGKAGIVIHGGNTNVISRSVVQYTGDDGIIVNGGSRENLRTSGHIVSDNVLTHFGRWGLSYSPGIKISGVGIKILHNRISYGPHAGVIYSGNNHRIEHNEISDVARETGDVGAIYAGRDPTMRGTAIRYNFVHDVTSNLPGGATGVYLDDLFSGTLVQANIFDNVDTGVLIGGGRDNRVVENVFLRGNVAVWADARGKDHKADKIKNAPANSSWDIRSKIEKVVKPGSSYIRQYPGLANLLNSDYLNPEGNRVSRNLYICGQQFFGTRGQVNPEWFERNANTCIHYDANSNSTVRTRGEPYNFTTLITTNNLARRAMTGLGPRLLE